MQLQLSLKVADRLHQALLVGGRPMNATVAARVLLSGEVSDQVATKIVDVLVREDRRFCWSAANPASLSLSAWEAPDPELCDVPYVALDLETTGARAGASKITEVGAVRLEGLRVVGQFATLVNPFRPIPPMIARITGITSQMVAGAPRIEDVVPGLLEFLEGAVVVAHNAPFDVGFLNYELHRLGGRALGDDAVDTLPLARALFPGLANYRLSTVAEALGSPVPASHRALADAQAVAHVFLRLVDALRERGGDRLSELRACATSSSRAHLEKLGLTRDLPEEPGAYTFVDNRGEALLVGRADSLAEEVRSRFTAGPRRAGGTRTAIRLVERIDWELASSPLEAVILEQDLVLRHRPPYNLGPTKPERYVYIKVRAEEGGLRLFASSRPSWQTGEVESDTRRALRDLTIGPFRRKASVEAALRVLRTCYPIRTCPPRSAERPCARGTEDLCLCPCAASSGRQEEHNALVTDLIWWLAGDARPHLPDPLLRADETARELSRRERYEEAGRLREDCEHLLSVRRAYTSLADARRLSFASLWSPPNDNGVPCARLGIVWEGSLRGSFSVCADSLEGHLDEAILLLGSLVATPPTTGTPALVAVPQTDLDRLLAVRHWFHQPGDTIKVSIPYPTADPDLLTGVRARIAAEARSLLSL